MRLLFIVTISLFAWAESSIAQQPSTMIDGFKVFHQPGTTISNDDISHLQFLRDTSAAEANEIYLKNEVLPYDFDGAKLRANRLSNSERTAIKTYTKDSRDINTLLRTNEIPDGSLASRKALKKSIGSIKKGAKKLPLREGRVFRAVKDNGMIQGLRRGLGIQEGEGLSIGIGSIIGDNAFQSSTSSLSFHRSAQFFNQPDDIISYELVSKSGRELPFAPNILTETFQPQFEVLFPNGSQFQIESVVFTQDGRRTIAHIKATELETIDRETQFFNMHEGKVATKNFDFDPIASSTGCFGRRVRRSLSSICNTEESDPWNSRVESELTETEAEISIITRQIEEFGSEAEIESSILLRSKSLWKKSLGKASKIARRAATRVGEQITEGIPGLEELAVALWVMDMIDTFGSEESNGLDKAASVLGIVPVVGELMFGIDQAYHQQQAYNRLSEFEHGKHYIYDLNDATIKALDLEKSQYRAYLNNYKKHLKSVIFEELKRNLILKYSNDYEKYAQRLHSTLDASQRLIRKQRHYIIDDESYAELSDQYYRVLLKVQSQLTARKLKLLKDAEEEFLRLSKNFIQSHGNMIAGKLYEHVENIAITEWQTQELRRIQDAPGCFKQSVERRTINYSCYSCNFWCTIAMGFVAADLGETKYHTVHFDPSKDEILNSIAPSLSPAELTHDSKFEPLTHPDQWQVMNLKTTLAESIKELIKNNHQTSADLSFTNPLAVPLTKENPELAKFVIEQSEIDSSLPQLTEKASHYLKRQAEQLQEGHSEKFGIFNPWLQYWHKEGRISYSLNSEIVPGIFVVPYDCSERKLFCMDLIGAHTFEDLTQ
ncbi:ADP-ribosyltransferase [Pseudobacteriovorax antillogorgiicola]|uniref:ADP-ribosyltransferase exoenzyme n=1 Tax=Pseudobacteriovorax antillogorgiicola TaxID=1513793 RepID=A0A1Y6BBL8_9BACT|nr:ADP-ribosyltransferase [Pseudobacteriovorax antillogorgiicola]TCS57304.1 ADP-ribosyltransferase exoenzyme [Pseudobacteriovorax antillogorgiicola]SMF02772.1 ADP-ribosyltransferase exoenzyme [Pseudobacteriovorax antillogorgiicola]